MKRTLFRILIVLSLGAFVLGTFSNCQQTEIQSDVKSDELLYEPYVVVLGIAQDAGYPQADCKKDCCKDVWGDKSLRKMVSCIGIVDPKSNQTWMIDATPDFRDQLRILKRQEIEQREVEMNLSGIFLTHAHIGHYTGLMHLGREAIGAQNMPVHAMPKMRDYLSTNGPWSQLVSLSNISLKQIFHDSIHMLNERLKIRPFLVPHRDEFSETVGYQIYGPTKSLMFIPDIDKWSKWEVDIVSQVERVDYALIDGSFYADGEIAGRDMSEIPHPFISETTELFDKTSKLERNKIHFIHLNHTNPALVKHSSEYENLIQKGYRLCDEADIFKL